MRKHNHLFGQIANFAALHSAALRDVRGKLSVLVQHLCLVVAPLMERSFIANSNSNRAGECAPHNG